MEAQPGCLSAVQMLMWSCLMRLEWYGTSVYNSELGFRARCVCYSVRLRSAGLWGRPV